MFSFEQKHAYDMRISDWSSGVCSSDLGYSAVQVAVGVKRAALVNKPESGHLAKAKVEAGRGLWELRVADDRIADFSVGGEIKADIFEVGQVVDVEGVDRKSVV